MKPLLIILTAVFLVLLLLALFFLRSEYERRHPKISFYTVRSDRIPESFSGKKIAFLCDLHGRTPGKAAVRMEALLQKSGADIVLIGGDMLTVHRNVPYDDAPLKRLLHAVPDGAKIYFSDGNHETRMQKNTEIYPGWAERYDRTLKEGGALRLKNERLVLEGSGGIFLSAADLPEQTYRTKFRKKALLPGYFTELLGKKPEGFEILLLHSPLYMREAWAYGADLVLSGHFHGGTIRLFGTGVMTPQFQFFNPWCRGFYRDKEKAGIVSGGLGTHSVNIRFNNRPEIVMITLEKDRTKTR